MATTTTAPPITGATMLPPLSARPTPSAPYLVAMATEAACEHVTAAQSPHIEAHKRNQGRRPPSHRPWLFQAEFPAAASGHGHWSGQDSPDRFDDRLRVKRLDQQVGLLVVDAAYGQRLAHVA